MAQSYDDVAVLINNNDQESIQAGEYYQDKNNVPNVNMIYVDMPTTEIIDSLEVLALLADIDSKINAIPLSDEINYIVTTIGCPQVASPWRINIDLNYRSFDMLVGTLEPNNISNPYSGETKPFTFVENGYRIVSRLEAGTLEGTLRLIDRGGVRRLDANQKVVLDFFSEPNSNSIVNPIFIQKAIAARDALDALSVLTQLDTVPEYFDVDESLLAYFFIGFGDVPVSPFAMKTQELGILKGSSTCARKSSYGTVLTVYDFLEAHCHGALGAYGPYYIQNSFKESIFFSNYFDISKNMTLGESAFSAMSLNTPLSLFGDPKSRIESLSSTDGPFTDLVDKIYPVPAKNNLVIEFANARERVLVFYNSTGQQLFSTKISKAINDIDISSIASGIFYVLVNEEDNVELRKIIKL